MVSPHLAMAAHAAHAASSSNSGTWVIYAIILVVGFLIGRLTGRRTGLKHLGQAEFNARWRNVRGVHRW